jgi:mannose-6-phosphate isomerase class I
LIELPNEPKAKYPDPLPGLPKPEYFERVRIYPLKIGANSSFDLKTSTTPAVVVAYKGDLTMKEKGKTFILKSGDIKWVDENTDITLMSEENGSIEGYIYEIRK